MNTRKARKIRMMAAEVKAVLGSDDIIALANKFHRVGECGEIKKEAKT